MRGPVFALDIWCQQRRRERADRGDHTTLPNGSAGHRSPLNVLYVPALRPTRALLAAHRVQARAPRPLGLVDSAQRVAEDIGAAGLLRLAERPKRFVGGK